MNRLRTSWLTLMAVILAGILPTQAATFNGNPATDGWTFAGNSLSLGTYIRGVAGFSFNVYSAGFTLTLSNPLNNGTTWQTGDQIIGLGGVMTTHAFFVPRLVAKFGASTAIFAPSSLGSPSGNGIGSFSAGDGGLGSVQVDYEFEYPGSGTLLAAGQNGVRLEPDNIRYYTGTSTLVDTDYARVLAIFQRINGKDVLKAWEIVLDLTAMSDDFGGAVPALNGRGDMALQQELGNYTDGFVPHVVPEPTPAFLVVGSLLFLLPVFGYRR